MAVRRILLLHNLLLAFGGIPLIYMGDEIGLLNDYSYLSNPDLADDNRWLHRPYMDWGKVKERQDWSSLCGRIYGGIRNLIETRKATPALHAQAGSFSVWTHNDHVFGLLRASPRGRVLVLANFSQEPQAVPRARLDELGFSGELVDLLQDRAIEDWSLVPLGAYDAMWLSRPRESERGRHAYYD